MQLSALAFMQQQARFYTLWGPMRNRKAGSLNRRPLLLSHCSGALYHHTVSTPTSMALCSSRMMTLGESTLVPYAVCRQSSGTQCLHCSINILESASYPLFASHMGSNQVEQQRMHQLDAPIHFLTRSRYWELFLNGSAVIGVEVATEQHWNGACFLARALNIDADIEV